MTASLELVLATANPDKALEIRAIIAAELEGAVVLRARPASVPEVVEDGATLTENARLKALALCRATGVAAVADDTGLEVAALGGAPGIYAARYAGEQASYRDNVDRLLGELSDTNEREATFRTAALVSFPDGSELVGEGSLEGTIATYARGDLGFGYDPVFVPHGEERTFAEMTSQEKARISHRARAFVALCGLLRARLEADTSS